MPVTAVGPMLSWEGHRRIVSKLAEHVRQHERWKGRRFAAAGSTSTIHCELDLVEELRVTKSRVDVANAACADDRASGFRAVGTELSRPGPCTVCVAALVAGKATGRSSWFIFLFSNQGKEGGSAANMRATGIVGSSAIMLSNLPNSISPEWCLTSSRAWCKTPTTLIQIISL